MPVVMGGNVLDWCPSVSRLKRDVRCHTFSVLPHRHLQSGIYFMGILAIHVTASNRCSGCPQSIEHASVLPRYALSCLRHDWSIVVHSHAVNV
jgi:hypothetical protein